jgi:hypothetical protein
MNNMGREIMAALKRFETGADGDSLTVGGSLVVSGATTLTTVSATVVQSDTVSEKTSAAGVTIDGVLLKDSGVVTGAGTVSAPVYSTTGDTNTGIFFPAADTIAFAEGGAEAIRIDSAGQLHLGNTTPTDGHTSSSQFFFGLTGNLFAQRATGLGIGGTYLLENQYVKQSTGDFAYTTSAPASRITLFQNQIIFSNSASGTAGDPVSNTERARITAGGYFKASNNGTYSNSTAPFHEFYQSSTDDVALLVRAANASQDQNVLQVTADRNTTNNTFYAISYFNVGAAAFKFRVADSGNVTNTNNSYGSISDVKLKQDIVDAGSQWDDIKNLRVRKYRWKSDPDGFMQMGLVAQEAEEVSPGLIEEHKDTKQETRTREVEKTREVEVTPAVLDEDGNVVEPAVMETEAYTEEEEYTERVATGTVTKSVKYSILYMKAVKALQEAMERIETLEAKVAALEGN